MKAATLTGIKRIEIRDIPDPEIKHASDVLVRMGTVGVCGSDVHYYAEYGDGVIKAMVEFD